MVNSPADVEGARSDTQVEDESQTSHPWHAMPTAKCLAALDTTAEGLTSKEARARLDIVGANSLPASSESPLWLIFLGQFRSPLIYILGLAGVVSLVIHEYTDAAFIAGVLVLNAVIGGIQEWKADRNTRALQKLLRVVASISRDGEVYELDAEQLVPGDVVWLESGMRVPADLRLLHTHGLEIDESLLTGESLAVIKDFDWSEQGTTSVADRLNMAYAGAVVVRGRGKGVVVSTGMSTHVGHLALDVMAGEGGRPPLLMRLERFTRVVGVAVLVAAVLVATLGVFFQGQTVSTMFMFAVALAVSAIPEGLPVAITVALAIATTRMAKRGVIVRKLGAVEGLGSCTLVASDKTGTLTCNELTVRRIHLANGHEYEVTGEGFEPDGQIMCEGCPVDAAEHDELEAIIRAVVLCNEGDLHRHDGHWVWRGDPTDIALLTMGAKLSWHREAALDAHPQTNEIPFESEHQFAATYHQMNVGQHVFVKGAPERIFAMSEKATDAAVIDSIRAEAERLAQNGHRVLAVAEGLVNVDLDNKEVPTAPNGLRLLGLVAMIDPLRPGVREAVEACHRAGLSACMVTGDHPSTAVAIGRDLGLPSDRVVTGAELEAASDEDLEQMVRDTHIFARVPPHQKLRIVEAAQRMGHFVAVTGDGVNDAPALRRANIGVAMGDKGTDVAREAADMVISDDNFATIVAGIEEGRIAYNNIRNVIYLLISTGAAEVVLVMLAVAFGYPLPLLPVQLLWLNLVTNGIQDVALAFEPGQGDELSYPPRPPRERIFNRLMIERTLVGSVVMGGVAFATFAWLLDQGWSETSARNLLLLLMVLFENVHIGNCRSETISAFRLSPLRAPILLAGTIIAQLIHIGAMYTPLGQSLLQTEPINFQTWFTLLGVSLTVFVAMEIHKQIWRWRQNHNELVPKR